MEKWIVDTDIGCDSDDCMALGLILSQDDIELMGVTTVSGKAYTRAVFAKNICDCSGRDIPVCRGNECSLYGEVLQSYMIEGALDVANANSDADVSEENTAVQFLRRTIEENPNEITLVAIGQLTNIAILFSVYPHIPQMLKSLVVMCGRYCEKDYCELSRWGTTEWNVKCDNYAASIVFQADVKECYVAGVEETCKFSKPALEMKNKLKNISFMKPVAESLKYHEDNFPVWFHDAVIVWAYRNKEKLRWKKGNIKIGIVDNYEATTKLYDDENGRHYVLADVSSDEFFDYYAKQMGFEWDK